MSRGGAHFTQAEFDDVLRQYDIGPVIDSTPVHTGNRRVPKKMIISEKGTWFLKRRAPGKDDIYHVAFAHAVQAFLKKRGFPVAGLVKTIHGNTALTMNGHTYELFHFMSGGRFDGAVPSVRAAADVLAQLHRHFEGFVFKWDVLKRTYHDSAQTRARLDSIASETGPHRPGKGWKTTADVLLDYCHNAASTVNSLGFASWPVHIVHGDWHPGNMLFLHGAVACVLDFDSARIAPAVTDLANGALHFSIIAGSPDPCNWPEYLDTQKFAAFIRGYCRLAPVSRDMLTAIPDLMIELMIAEAVYPIADTGLFEHLCGFDFLQMISRKCRWIDQNRKMLHDHVLSRE